MATSDATAKTEVPRTDTLGYVAHGLYVLVGGLLIFAFAWSLLPAVRSQNEAPCRPFTPEARTGAAPDFTVEDLEGNPVSLSDFRGKLVLLNFWATWCEPCVKEWPQFDRLAQRLADRDDVVILAVSIDKEKPEIPPFLQKMTLGETGVRVLWDETTQLHTTFGSEKIPDTYVVDPEGQLKQAYINVRDWGTPTGYHCVESLLAQ